MKRWCKAFIVQHVTRTSEAATVTSDNRPASRQVGEGNGITPFTLKQMSGEKGILPRRPAITLKFR